MEALLPIIELAEATNLNPEREGDYKQDGLLHCGRCRTAKQYRIDILGKSRIFPILCQCEGERKKREDAERETRERWDEVFNLPIARLHDTTIRRIPADAGINPNMSVARRCIDKWGDMKAKNASLIFSGGVGCGKTYAAASVVNALNERYIPALMLTTSTAIDRGMGFGVEYDFLEQLNAFELVVFDDFGAERTTEYSTQKLFDIINARVSQQKPMILTTNYDRKRLESPENLEEQRIFSRVLGACTVIDFKGGDLRLRGK